MFKRKFQPMSREQRLAKQAEMSAKRKVQEALDLINHYRDLFELFSDAIFLGQIQSLTMARYYVMDVRNKNYIQEKPSYKELSELFRLAATQRV